MRTLRLLSATLCFSLNGDGWLDVISVNTQGSTLRVYLRNAPNTFAAPIESVLPFARPVNQWLGTLRQNC